MLARHSRVSMIYPFLVRGNDWRRLKLAHPEVRNKNQRWTRTNPPRIGKDLCELDLHGCK
jgi:hypothetical protein